MIDCLILVRFFFFNQEGMNINIIFNNILPNNCLFALNKSIYLDINNDPEINGLPGYFSHDTTNDRQPNM